MAEGEAKRRLAAILVADVVGYSRLMEADEAGTLARLKAHRAELIDPKVSEHRGRVIKLMGDGALVEFASIVDAVTCAVSIQRAMRVRNAAEPESNRIEFRIGINLGDLIVDGDDLYGDGLNIAARLEGLADPGGICVSSMVQQNVKGKLDVAFDDLGDQQLKNLAEPVRAYRIRLGGIGSLAGEPSPSLPLPERPSIAVLPFTNMSGDPEQEYFSDGITEDIITELSRFRSLFVIARNSSFHYKAKSPKIQDVGRELGVQYVVEGSVRKVGNRVRVTAQLVEAASGNHIWAEKYDRELDDIFAVQDDLVQSVATAIPGQLDEARINRVRRNPSEDLTAYDHLLRGEWLLRENFSSAEALPHFEMAIAIDPQCARAFCRLAAYHGYSVFLQGTSAEEAQRLAQTYAERALAIDDSDAFVHAITAGAYIYIGSHDLCRRHIDRAIALNPNDIDVIRIAGATFAYLGDTDEALKWNKKYLRLEPHFADGIREYLFDTYYLARRYEDAIVTFRGWRNPPPHLYSELAAAHAQLNQMSEARLAVAEFERAKPEGFDFAAFCRAHAKICARPEDAEHWLDGYRKAGLIA